MASNDIVFCFPDTNALIHFKTFTEVKWPELLKTDSVTLVLAPSVLRELDRHKDGSQEWRRGRARMLLSKINELLDPLPEGETAIVGPGVNLDYITENPRIDWEEFGLDRYHEDDRILASIKEFSDSHSGARIILLSNDTLPKLKAKRLGIEAVDPAKFLKRLELKSEEEREMSRMRTELEKLRSRIPDLSVEFLRKGEATQELVLLQPRDRSRWIGPDEISAAVEAERQECLALVDEETRQAVPDAWRDYLREVNYYCDDFETYLLCERAYSSAWIATIAFVVRNSGNANATGIEAEIDFPEETMFGRQGEWEHKSNSWSPPEGPGRPKPPSIPRPIRVDQIAGVGSFERFVGAINPNYMGSLMYPSLTLTPGTSTSPFPEPTRYAGTRVLLEPMAIRAASKWSADIVVANLPPPRGNRVMLPFRVHARECDKPTEGNLVISFIEADG